uniref:OO_Ba0013J05-OO_Ba0033A15.35 protein n=1 Tax=Oryza officinalis TaxID=4535 RepID=D0ABH8_9ORYZ|nr:OO_Ba0013J05-OO_Ba0033A15.35 [Oryza officinalis]
MAKTHEKDMQSEKEEEGEKEKYVLLELDDCLYSDGQPNASYVLSGLDTLTPTLILGDGLKMMWSMDLLIVIEILCALDSLQPYIANWRIPRDYWHMLFVLRNNYFVQCSNPFLLSDAPPKPIHGEMAPPEENKDKQANCSKEVPSKEVKHLASVQKILKFRSINADHEQRRAYRDNEKEI